MSLARTILVRLFRPWLAYLSILSSGQPPLPEELSNARFAGASHDNDHNKAPILARRFTTAMAHSEVSPCFPFIIHQVPHSGSASHLARDRRKNHLPLSCMDLAVRHTTRAWTLRAPLESARKSEDTINYHHPEAYREMFKHI